MAATRATTPSSSTRTLSPALVAGPTPDAVPSPNDAPRQDAEAPLEIEKESLDEKTEQKTVEEPSKSEDDAAWDEHPANPRNWSLFRKWRSVALVSFYTFISPLASSMMAPGLPAISVRYHISSPTIVALTLSIYLLAFSIGPFFVGPLSEMYGRTWVLHISNMIFTIFTLASIFAPNTGSLIAFRFFAGLGGCTPVSIGGGTVSDVFNDRERSTAMAVYTMGPLLGPVLGPIAGGFVVQTIGVRWVFILLTILGGGASVLSIPLLEETYAPVVRKRIQMQIAQNREQGDVEAGETPKDGAGVARKTLAQSLRENLSRPVLLLTRSLICFMLSLYMALIYGYLYLMFTTFPTLFGNVYGWGPGISGLAYLGPGMGFLVSTLGGGRLLNKVYTTLSDRNGGKGKPEYRIPCTIIGSLFVPIGLFWYGWSAQARAHWIMPIIGSGIFAAGMMLVFLPMQLYLVDAFTFAASALAAAASFRSLLGFAFPLFGEQMFVALGFGGGNSLLAGMAIVTGIPFPIWLYFRGEQARLRNPLNRVTLFQLARFEFDAFRRVKEVGPGEYYRETRQNTRGR